MAEDDVQYFRRRAVEEKQASEYCSHSAVRSAYRELARQYEQAVLVLMEGRRLSSISATEFDRIIERSG